MEVQSNTSSRSSLTPNSTEKLTGFSKLQASRKRWAMRQRLAQLLQEKARRQASATEKARLENDLGAFFRAAWDVLEPGRPLEWSFHYEYMAELLKLVSDGRFQEFYPDAAGILFNVPPRTAKSTFVTICYPVWDWLRHPSRRYQCFSYSGKLSEEHSVKRRDLIRSAWFEHRWADRFKLKEDQNQRGHFGNDRTGAMIATSVGGTATGQGGDTLIVDDPLDPDQAASDTERKKANDWIDNTLRSRVNDPSSGLILMVMQRLAELDPTGYVMAQEPGRWVHVKVPLEAEEDERWEFPISGRVVLRAAGDCLQPGRFPQRVVERLKVRRLVWAGQYQQRPSPLEGNMIKRRDVRYYGGIDPATGEHDQELPEDFDLVLVSADCAFKDLKTSDFVAVGAIGVKGPDRFVLNVTNSHLDEPGTEMEILRQRNVHHASAVLVEDKANGPAVIKKLKRKIPGVIEIEPQGGKTARMYAASGEWQSGNWYVDRNAAWTDGFISQLCTVPNAAHDDMADMMSQASVWLQNNSFGLFEQWRREAEAIKENRGKPIDRAAQPQEQKDELFGRRRTQGPKAPAKKAGEPATKGCPKCGSDGLARYPERRWRCNSCGAVGQDEA